MSMSHTNVQALRLAADMCLHYRLVDSDLWTKLLTALLALEMVTLLCTTLRCV